MYINIILRLNLYKTLKASIHSPLLFQIVTSEARKIKILIIKILANYLNKNFYFNK